MILLDTNVLIYASLPASDFHAWAVSTIAGSVVRGGCAVDSVSLAEICVGDDDPASVTDRLGRWGVEVLDTPVSAAVACAAAFRTYRARRRSQSGSDAPSMPLPDFFIGAHALVREWDLATADPQRFRTYFPEVRLLTP